MLPTSHCRGFFCTVTTRTTTERSLHSIPLGDANEVSSSSASAQQKRGGLYSSCLYPELRVSGTSSAWKPPWRRLSADLNGILRRQMISDNNLGGALSSFLSILLTDKKAAFTKHDLIYYWKKKKKLLTENVVEKLRDAAAPWLWWSSVRPPRQTNQMVTVSELTTPSYTDVINDTIKRGGFTRDAILSTARLRPVPSLGNRISQGEG